MNPSEKKKFQPTNQTLKPGTDAHSQPFSLQPTSMQNCKIIDPEDLLNLLGLLHYGWMRTGVLESYRVQAEDFASYACKHG